MPYVLVQCPLAERPRSCSVRWTAWQPSTQQTTAAAAHPAAAAAPACSPQQPWTERCTRVAAHLSTCWCARAGRRGCRTFCCGSAGTRCWSSPRCCGQSLGSWTWWQQYSSTSASTRTCSACRRRPRRRQRQQRRRRCTGAPQQPWRWRCGRRQVQQQQGRQGSAPAPGSSCLRTSWRTQMAGKACSKACSAALHAPSPPPPRPAAPAAGRKGRQKAPAWRQQQQRRQHMQKPCSRGDDEQLPGNSSPAAPPGTHEPDSSFCFEPQHPLLFGSQAPIIFPCTAPLIYGEAISIFCEAGSLESTQHKASWGYLSTAAANAQQGLVCPPQRRQPQSFEGSCLHTVPSISDMKSALEAA